MKCPKPKRKAKRKKIPAVSKIDAAIRTIVFERDRRCVLCGSIESLQWSHLISRRKWATRWDLRNSAVMCARCHYKHHKQGPEAYTSWFLQKYGAEEYEALRIKAYTPMSSAERRALIVSLSEKLL